MSEVTRLVQKQYLIESKKWKDKAESLKTEDLQPKGDNSEKEKKETDKKQEKQTWLGQKVFCNIVYESETKFL